LFNFHTNIFSLFFFIYHIRQVVANGLGSRTVDQCKARIRETQNKSSSEEQQKIQIARIMMQFGESPSSSTTNNNNNGGSCALRIQQRPPPPFPIPGFVPVPSFSSIAGTVQSKSVFTSDSLSLLPNLTPTRPGSSLNKEIGAFTTPFPTQPVRSPLTYANLVRAKDQMEAAGIIPTFVDCSYDGEMASIAWREDDEFDEDDMDVDDLSESDTHSHSHSHSHCCSPFSYSSSSTGVDSINNSNSMSPASFTHTRNSIDKKQYVCHVCGLMKRNHECLNRPATKEEKLAQKRELSQNSVSGYTAPDTPSTIGFDGDADNSGYGRFGARSSYGRRRSKPRARTALSFNSPRKGYTCKLCGLLKKGHVCLYRPASREELTYDRQYR